MTHPLLQDLTVSQVINAFDLLPDTLFWIKDVEGRIVHCNRVFLEYRGMRKLEQIVGKTDLDFSAPHIAAQYIQDDQQVLKGALVTDRLELNSINGGEYGWFSTSKRPLINAQGNVIGTYGITQRLDKDSEVHSHVEAISVPVQFVRDNYQDTISIKQLADIAHLSVSALERRFKKYLGKTPNQFILEVRLESARRELIETDLPVAQVAFQSGFSEPSYFSKKFKGLFGCLPTELREQALLTED